MNKELKRKIKDSFLVVGDATRGYTKQVAYNLRELGRRATDKFVWKHGQQHELNYPNFYENFLGWLTALFYANYAGFELLWTHLNIFVADLQKTRSEGLLTFPAQSEVLGAVKKIEGELEMLKGCLGLQMEVRA